MQLANARGEGSQVRRKIKKCGMAFAGHGRAGHGMAFAAGGRLLESLMRAAVITWRKVIGPYTEPTPGEPTPGFRSSQLRIRDSGR